MKRKRRNDQANDLQTCDLILTDANGRSIRVHRALLMDRSDYFARILAENRMNVLQLNEKYLIDLIHYLYNHESGESQLNNHESAIDEHVNDGDIEILMNMLALSKKYEFKQLYQSLLKEVNQRLKPSTALLIYRLVYNTDIEELKSAARIMILIWLPRLQTTEAYYELPEAAIYSLFENESPYIADIHKEDKLNALSTWWSHNKNSDMTDLWVKLNKS